MKRLRVFCLTAVLMVDTACSPIRVPPYPRTPPSVIGSNLSRADAIADLDTLMHTLEDVHPNLYAVRSREATAAERSRLVAELPESLSRADWWLRLSPFVAGFGDGHTNIGMPGEELVRDPAVLIFPAALALDEERHVIVNLSFDPDGGLKRGDRILRINGQDADAFLQSWTSEISGESDWYREVTVADLYREMLQIHGIGAPYQVRVSGLDGAERDATLAGITREGLRRAFRPKASNPGGSKSSKSFSYRVLEEGIGYMDLRTFGGDLPQFQKDVAAMFRQVAADHDSRLIIDLRNNGGGDSRLADALLRYITTTPYRMNAREEWKMSGEYRAYLKTLLRPPLRWLPVEQLVPLGRKLYAGPPGRIVPVEEKLKKPARAEPFFSGAVFMLIGPRTFSSATDLADAVKTYHLATLMGEETGGRPNTFGQVYPFMLPHCGFLVSVSSEYFIRANGDASDARGVVPDIVVTRSREDMRTSRDVVLERARTASPGN